MTHPVVVPKDIELRAADGFLLAAKVHEPVAPPTHTVLIGGANGVPQGFYTDFALELTRAGARVLTFDYRHVGASLRTDLRSARGRLTDWGLYDLDVALETALELAPSAPLRMVGHSLGAQFLGLSRHAGRVERVLCVAGGSGYWGHYGERAEINRVYWSEQIANAVKEDGYLNGRKHKFVDMCAEMANDVVRWCMNPHYMIDDHGEPFRPHHHDVRGDMLFLVPSDDHLSPRQAVEHTAGFFTQAPVRIEMLEPSSVGQPIGHFGFFRREVAGALWAPRIQWLLS